MTINRPPKPQFVLHLEALPKHGDDSGMYRLKGILKRLLRAYGFRCKQIEYPDASNPDDDETPPRHA